MSLLAEFDEPTFAILKHNNACGLACRSQLSQAYADALAGDPVSAFGGVLLCNQPVDEETATAVNQLFFEIIAAPDFEINALQLLRSKKNRVILRLRDFDFPEKQFKSVLNGILQQDRDSKSESVSDFKLVTSKNRMLANSTTWCLPTKWQSTHAQTPLCWPKQTVGGFRNRSNLPRRCFETMYCQGTGKRICP